MPKGIVRLLTALLLAGAGFGSHAASPPEQQLLFRVLLDDSEIGYHAFRITRQGQQQVIEIDAEFKVKFLGITVYRYEHRNREGWRQGCLESIASTTVDGGDDFRVEGRRVDGQFLVSTQDGERGIEAGCMMTFAYWDRDFLQQASLLNSQNGEYLAVKVEDEGVETLQLNGRKVAASRHRLSNAEREIDITVWHREDDGHWLSLESRVEGGRVIRYLPATRDEIDSWRPPGSGAADDGESPESGGRK